MWPQLGRQIAMMMLLLLLVECQDRQDRPTTVVVLRWDSAARDPLSAQNDPPDAILVRWTTASAVDVSELADRHCLAWHRRAARVREDACGDTRVAEFVCRSLTDR